ncbi:hypothetical protein N7541_001350 [Penicillium brevicompactum]|uniref:Peptide N-acetyl-beta-D-glucosaminyl asparaginase amidase A N-terminal domain-containing protein n=1 Tax=Penicillium brevicompactum TaxID=5074 RepID=A0A9W9RXY3_PENBR|nr:hypothetical protein N7541_001350 [Penicillium brevicompactum]
MFDTVRINLTVTSRGRQFDRLASLYLGDIEVFRTSTAEPTEDGIVWTYMKEMSQYNSLWKSPQTIIFDLDNLITDLYTGSFNVILTARFSYEDNVRTADLILPISAQRSAFHNASAFQIPSDNTTVIHTIPERAYRAVVSIFACGQSQEEFWWENVFSQDTRAFEKTVIEVYGYTPFREIQLYIDGTLAGVVWPFPMIFTGGIAAVFWSPLVGIDAFDFRQPEIDISAFLPIIQDGEQHSFEIRVTGLDVSADGNVTFSNMVNSYWTITGNIFLYFDDRSSSADNVASERKPPDVDAPMPAFAVTRSLTRNQTGETDSLSYSMTVERSFRATSSLHSWSQKCSFSHQGLLSYQGRVQINTQLTTGNHTVTNFGNTLVSDSVIFRYPLHVNASLGSSDNGSLAEYHMQRGLDIERTGGPDFSTFTMGTGPSYLHTSQAGTAWKNAVTGQGMTSWGDTHHVFESEMGGQRFQRNVFASNGSIVEDTNPQSRHSN